MAKQKELKEVSAKLNLASAMVALSANTKKIMDFSSYKNKELLKSTEKLLLKQKISR